MKTGRLQINYASFSGSSVYIGGKGEEGTYYYHELIIHEHDDSPCIDEDLYTWFIDLKVGGIDYYVNHYEQLSRIWWPTPALWHLE